MTEQPWAQKEHGILFKDRLVRGILRGTKIETRRLVTAHTGRCETAPIRSLAWDGRGWPDPTYEPAIGMVKIPGPHETTHRVWSRYEQGDTLWVREAHTFSNGGATIYRADYPDNCERRGMDNIPPVEEVQWKPSIHMPRTAARILLEITAMGCERVQDITDDGAIREGVEARIAGEDFNIDGEWWAGAPRRRFRELWDRTNGHRAGASWRDNPLVWVIRFRVMERGP